MKATVSGGYKNLRGKRVRSYDILGREFVGTVITHLRDNKWCVEFNGVRVTLKRSEFSLVASTAHQRAQRTA